MKKTLIKRLNQINKSFYQQTATSFSDSRSYYWQGWNKLVPYLQELAAAHDQQLTILDIGCGNGRFGAFIAEQLPALKINYYGFDNNQELLQIAQEQPAIKTIKSQFIKLDLVEALLKEELLTQLQSFKANFITALGVLHHIPSFELRQQFVNDLTAAVTQPGFVSFTTWNFLKQRRFEKKIMDPSLVNLDPAELEENDVILDWKRGEQAFRYCHYTAKAELDQLIAGSGLEESSRFKADGKTGRLNTYTVLKK